MKNMVIFPLLILTYCSPLQAAQGDGFAQSKLYKYLLDGHTPVRPVRDWKQSIKVSFGLYIFQLLELSSVGQHLEFVGTISMSWKDEFLQWNMTEYDINKIWLPSMSVWTPSIAIMNRADGLFLDPKWKDYKVEVQHDGQVTWAPGGLISTSCDIDIRYFPFDTQICKILIVHWGEYADQVNLTSNMNKVSTWTYIDNKEWILEDTSMDHYEHVNTNDPANPVYNTIEAFFKFKRISQSYVTSLVVPILLLSLSGTLIFSLAPDSGEKISLGLTIMLGFTVFQLILAENLPQSSQETPLMMTIVTVLMIINGISIAMTVFILHLHHRQTALEIPNWLRKFIFNILAKVLCKKRSEAKTCTLDSIAMKADNIENSYEVNATTVPVTRFDDNLAQSVSEILIELKKITKKIESTDEVERQVADWKEIASILDRLFFIISLIAFFVILAMTALLLP